MINIRRAISDDSEQILKLLVQVNNVHSKNRPDLFLWDKTKYTKDELIKILDDDNTPVFVAVTNDGVVAGYAFGIFQSHIEDNNFPDIVTFYIDDICVDENHRKMHIGTKLFEYVRDFAFTKGCYNVTLNVWDKNEAAMKFYEKCGFKVQKYGMEIIRPNN